MKYKTIIIVSVLIAIAALSGCAKQEPQTGNQAAPTTYECGNGVLEQGEECETTADCQEGECSAECKCVIADVPIPPSLPG